MARRLFVGSFFAFAFALGGCAEPDTIVTYKVPRVAPVPESVLRAVEEYRLLGAIIPGTGRNSFFVLMQGKAVDLAPHAEEFDAFVKGMKFPDGLGKEPVWTLPKGWAEDRTKNPNPAMPRIATFYPNGADRGLEITLTQFQGELITNVNRWRGKVGLPGVEEEELKDAAPAYKVETGQTWYKVDAKGKKDPTGVPGMKTRPNGT